MKFDAVSWWLEHGHVIGEMTHADRILPADLQALADAAVEAARTEVEAKPATVRFGTNVDGSLDEMYAESARFHIEQMSDTHWWMAVEVGDKRIDINLTSKAKIKANVSDESVKPLTSKSS